MSRPTNIGSRIRRAWTLSGCLVLAAVLMGQDDCSTTTTDQSDPSSDSGGKEKKPRSKVGDAITLEGNDDNKVKVKVVKVDRDLSVGEFDEPQKGRKFVGVFVRLTNVGDKTYDDSPSNGAQLITNKDEQADSAMVSSGDCGSSFASDATISPGSSQQGCIPFEVKEKAKPKTFQFGLDSGFGPETGEWSLK